METPIRARMQAAFVTPEGALGAALATVASLICASTPALGPHAGPWWYAVVAVGLLVYRVAFERAAHAGGWIPGLLFAGHVPICLGLVALHPLYGVYAFIGYVDAARVLPGVGRWIGTCAMAPVVAFSQIGGLVGRWATWPVYGVFVAVNVVIALTMAGAERARERRDAERLATTERLLAAERENASLQARLAEEARAAGVLDDRARLSREIHDTVAQGLVGIVRQLEAIDPTAPPADWRWRIDRAGESARDALAEARRAVAALASPRLDEDDLPTALDRLLTTWSARCGITGRLVVDGTAEPGAHDQVVLRVVQESLANVERHSGASRVVVTLTYGAASRDGLRVDVRDDGAGFDVRRLLPHREQAGHVGTGHAPDGHVTGHASAAQVAAGHGTAGHGLAGMRRRVAEVGGTWDVETGPGDGCALSVAVPLLPPSSDDVTCHVGTRDDSTRDGSTRAAVAERATTDEGSVDDHVPARPGVAP